jgi:outer membrane protein assembly factor BamB
MSFYPQARAESRTMTTIFSDSFQSGTLLTSQTPPGAWDGDYLPDAAVGGSESVESSVVYNGYSYAANFTAETFQQYGCVYKTFSANYTSLYSGADVMFTRMPLYAVFGPTLCGSYDKGTFFCLTENISGSTYWGIEVIYDDSYSDFLQSTPSNPVPNVWYNVELYGSIGTNSGDGVATLWVNGALTLNETGLGPFTSVRTPLTCVRDEFWLDATELSPISFYSDNITVYGPGASASALWNYTTGGAVYSSSTVAGGLVYSGSDDNHVYCLNAASGGQVWNYTTGNDVESSPAVAGGLVYVGSDDNHVYCLNATNGTQVWNYTTGGAVWSSPAVVAGLVYVGSDDDNVYCLNATTGTRLWNYTTGNAVWSSPAVAGGLVYVGSDDNNVYCLNAASGARVWNYTTGSDVVSSPAVAAGLVYVGSDDDNVYCLNATTGAWVWNYTTGGYVHSSPAVVAGLVYVGSFDDSVYCLNAANGMQVWNYTTGSWVESSPAVVGGLVYVGSNDESVYCLNAASGAFVWSYTTGGFVESSPAVVNGVVYVGSMDGKIYAFAPTLYNLTVSVSGHGVTSLTGTSTQDQYSNVAVLATPDSGYVLNYWLLNGTDVGSANPYTVNMTGDWSLTAVFSSAVYLSLNVDPNQPTYSGNQPVTFTVTVINEAGSSVNSTLTLTVTGPGGYGYFDFDRIKATSGFSEDSFDWTVPNAAGTYVVEVSLVPMQLTAYDAAWLVVGGLPT